MPSSQAALPFHGRSSHARYASHASAVESLDRASSDEARLWQYIKAAGGCWRHRLPGACRSWAGTSSGSSAASGVSRSWFGSQCWYQTRWAEAPAACGVVREGVVRLSNDCGVNGG